MSPAAADHVYWFVIDPKLTNLVVDAWSFNVSDSGALLFYTEDTELPFAAIAPRMWISVHPCTPEQAKHWLADSEMRRLLCPNPNDVRTVYP